MKSYPCLVVAVFLVMVCSTLGKYTVLIITIFKIFLIIWVKTRLTLVAADSTSELKEYNEKLKQAKNALEKAKNFLKRFASSTVCILKSF